MSMIFPCGPAGSVNTTAVVTGATWNPADKYVSLILSGGDLTVTAPSGSAQAASVRGTTSTSSGKKYYEHHIGAATHIEACSIGWAVASFALNIVVGSASGGQPSFGYGGTGIVFAWVDGSPLTTIQPYAVGDTIGVALDFDNYRAWFRTSTNTNWNNDVIGNQNPATNTGGVTFIWAAGTGPWFPAASLFIYVDPPEVATTNFGATPYVMTPPSGFSNW